MQQCSIYLPAIIQGTVGILTLLVSAVFYFNYSREKAKNKAAIEDLDDITTIVERVKNQFTQQTEELKTELSFASQQKLKFRYDEVQAIIDYNKCLAASFHYQGSLIGDDAPKSVIEVDNILKQISKLNFDSNLSATHLNIFINDKIMIDILQDYTRKAYVFEETLKSSLRKIKKYYYDEALNIIRTNEERERMKHIIAQQAEGIWKTEFVEPTWDAYIEAGKSFENWTKYAHGKVNIL